MNVAATQDTEIPIQYLKINYFQEWQSLSECSFLSSFEDDNRFNTGWQWIVQSDIPEWIPSKLIQGLAFIVFEDDAAPFDDCKGMCQFYVAKYRVES
jgi:hypothetical protein